MHGGIYVREFIAVGVLLLAVLVSGCTTTTDTGNTTVPDIPYKTYSDSEISFRYPESWTSENLTIQSPNAIAAVADPASVESSGNIVTLVIVQSIPLPAGKTLKDVYDETYRSFEQQSGYQLISERTLTINGVTAYENVHRINIDGVTKQERATWLEKNGKIYVILCGTSPEKFDAENRNFDLITYSFQVK
mgnify:FL=1